MNGQAAPGRAPAVLPRVLIFGMPRSGTSWLMKTFDHHPHVFAIYEPEALEPDPDRTDQDPEAYVDRLFACRRLRAMRRRPLLRKAYRSAPAHAHS